MKVETDAIILKNQKYREYDEIILAYTKDYGKLRMFARSSKRMKSPLLSGTQIFANSKLIIDLKENGSNLYEASLIKSFYEFSTNLSKYYLASYIVEMLDKLQVDNQTDSKLYTRVLNIFYSMLKYDYIKLIRVVFEIFMIDSLGIRPITDRCGICDNKEEFYQYFDIEQGSVICNKCKKNIPGSIRIDKNLIKFINFVYKYSSDVDRILDAKISESLLSKLDDFVHTFLDFHINNNINIKSYNILKEEEKLYDNFRNDRPSS